MTMKVYVTAPAGIFLVEHGGRAYGESFDLPDEVAQVLIERGEVSTADPNEPTTTRKKKADGVGGSDNAS